jgi:hypothetical protein
VSEASPRATRIAPPRWRDTRLVLGVLLVLTSVVVGARVFAAAGRYTTVYLAASALVPGEHLSAADLSVGRVRFGTGGQAYIAATGPPPVGYLVNRFVGAGELVPLAALSSSRAAAAQSRLVTVPVSTGHLPGDLAHGDLVDVYVTAKVGGGAAVPPPTLVIAAVPVDAVAGDSESLAGAAATAVVLAVPVDQVASIVHAVESGVIDLVVVPPSAAERLVPAATPSASPR